MTYKEFSQKKAWGGTINRLDGLLVHNPNHKKRSFNSCAKNTDHILKAQTFGESSLEADCMFS